MPGRKTFLSTECRFAFVLLLALSLPLTASAQTVDALSSLTGDVEIRGRGWAQIYDSREMLEFLLAVFETVVLTSLIAFHPKSRSRWQERRDWETPRTFFLYALVGMVVGFLVMHHGYLIGFVVFGIGSFLRFRSEASSLIDTPQLLFASLIGLVIGLDLPAMAFVATLSAFVVIWIFGNTAHFALEVKFDESVSYADALARLEASLADQGFRIDTVSKSKFKPVAEIVMNSSDADARKKLVHALAEVQRREDSGIADWHLE